MVIISTAYILDYKIIDKYIYEGMQFINKTDNVEEISKIIDDDEITPYVNLTFNIHLEGFGIYDILNDKFIEPDSIDAFGHKNFSIKKKVN